MLAAKAVELEYLERLSQGTVHVLLKTHVEKGAGNTSNNVS